MLRMLQAAAVGVALLLAPLEASDAPTTQRVNPDAATLAEFMKRVESYVALHKKLEATLPKLPAQTDPVTIDKHQRALARLIQDTRTAARPGDIFFPAMQQLLRRLLRPIFSGPDGRQIKTEIL